MIITVLVDGGVSAGLDVMRMLALGAGVTKLLAIVEAEIRIAMPLTGVTQIDAIDTSILAGR